MAAQGKYIPEVQDAIVRYPEAIKRYNLGVPSSGRIINGQEVTPNSVPWQCRLSLLMPDGARYFCGCSVISEQWILTAAHCTQGIAEVTVTIGDHSISASDNTESETTVDKSQVRINNQWNSNTLQNDISLIQVPTVTFTDAIQPICVAANDPTNLHIGDRLTVTGWGITADGAPSVSNVLNAANVTGISKADCAAYYGTANIKDSQLCTNAPVDQQSTCSGDSGGPLTTLQNGVNIPVQVGIVSFGSASGCLKGPTGFARVSSFRDWILTNTAGSNVKTCNV